MTPRILIAEDEAISRKHLTYALEKEGYVITNAADGNEAYALFEKKTFDVIIADIKMPGMDGHTLLEKKKDPDMDVIIITGFGSIESAIDAMKKGASEYVTKPFNLEELNLEIAKVLEKKG